MVTKVSCEEVICCLNAKIFPYYLFESGQIDLVLILQTIKKRMGKDDIFCCRLGERMVRDGGGVSLTLADIPCEG